MRLNNPFSFGDLLPGCTNEIEGIIFLVMITIKEKSLSSFFGVKEDARIDLFRMIEKEILFRKNHNDLGFTIIEDGELCFEITELTSETRTKIKSTILYQAQAYDSVNMLLVRKETRLEVVE